MGWLRLLPLVAVSFGLWACSSDGDDGTCHTNSDCTSGEGKNLSCINGACRELCESDAECQDDNPRGICEDLLCVDGCLSDADCGGDRCIKTRESGGRCAVFFESFEPEQGESFASLDSLRARESNAWDDIPRAKLNNASKVVFTGVPGCGIETEDVKCAGPAAHGLFYLAASRVNTPPRGLPDASGVTCTACKCCRDCRDGAARLEAYDPQDPTCLGVQLTLNPAPVCSPGIPAECQQVCSDCDACQDVPPDRIGDNLNACELKAAQKTCSRCGPYEACLERATTSEESAACATTTEGKDCLACREFVRLREQFPNEPLEWREQQLMCEGQGNDGCYATTIDLVRSGLYEDEQALVSPEIPQVAGITGDLFLQFEYLAFNIGKTYTRVVQGEPDTNWGYDEKQELVIQLCGQSCEDNASWKDATLASGGAASVPSDDERGNGLGFAQQNSTDWTVNRRRVVIPPELRTASFRFRLLPRMADGARIGIDNIVIRRGQ